MFESHHEAVSIRRPVPAAATDAARLLAEVWAVDEHGLPAVPVDPILIADKLGLDVFVADMNEDFAGVLEARPGADPAVYLNRNDSRNRQRFTCAHEIGHYYHRTKNGELTYRFNDRRDGLARQGTDPDEIYANQFGAALIMPEGQVRRLCRTMGRVELAVRFGVSEDAMRYRLVNLGLAAG